MDTVYEDNLRLSQLEYRQQHIYLRSQPRCLSLVFGNACNIYCPHCYQSKNGDNLLRPAEIGRELRREFMGLYPYLSTLRILGGEPFAIVGFRELIEDAASIVHRPVISVSTNGTLIDEEWAERIVRLPFSNLTVSIDGGTPPTYARLRRGADLNKVLANVQRIQGWKQKLGSELPHLDTFFVVMRSNFREIPQYLDLASANGFTDVSLQTMEVNNHNAGREPALERDETIADAAEIRELHAIMKEVLPRNRRRFRMVRTSGMTSLFASQGLDTSFLREETEGIYPDSDDMAEAAEQAAPSDEAAGIAIRPNGADSVEAAEPHPNGDAPAAPAGQAAPAVEAPGSGLCPNPWTTLFVAENGDVLVCFLSVPIGNLYETPLSRLWNSQPAMAQRSNMVSGRYMEAGCSERWCSWREGNKAAPPASDKLVELRAETAQLADRVARTQSLIPAGQPPSAIPAVRRMVASREQRIQELEVMFKQLCDNTAAIQESAQQHIAHLESKAEASIAALEKNTAARAEAQQHIAHLEAKADTALAEFRKLEQEFTHYRELPLIHGADALSGLLSRLRRAVSP